jgi:hypothetical protein
MIHWYGAGLDMTKLPSDGEAPLGLGTLIATEVRDIDDWENERVAMRKFTRSLYIDRAARRARLIAAGVPKADLDDIVRENASWLSESHTQLIAATKALNEHAAASTTNEEAREGAGGFRDLDEAAADCRRERMSCEELRKRQRQGDGGDARVTVVSPASVPEERLAVGDRASEGPQRVVTAPSTPPIWQATHT